MKNSMTEPSSFALGVDIGGTTIKALIAGLDGTVVATVPPVPTPTSGAEDVGAAVKEVVTSLRENNPELPLIDTIGVCVPGIIDEKAGVIKWSANLGWNNDPLRDIFSAATNSPVVLGHDVKTGALAEAAWGVKLPSCYYIALGTGIAGGAVIQGNLLPTPPWAGEVGQLPITHPETGERTSLESVCSAVGIGTRAVNVGLVPAGCGSKELIQESAHNEEALKFLTDSLDILAKSIAPILHQLGQMPVVVGGGLAMGGSVVLENLEKSLAKYTDPFPSPRVYAAALAGNSQALGSAARAFIQEGLTPVSAS